MIIMLHFPYMVFLYQEMSCVECSKKRRGEERGGETVGLEVISIQFIDFIMLAPAILLRSLRSHSSREKGDNGN